MDGDVRKRIDSFLAAGHLGVLSTAGPRGVISLPVQYRVEGLDVTCAVPCWSDLAYLVEEDPAVTLVLVAESPNGFRWLQYRGQASRVTREPWTGFEPVLPKGMRPADLFRFLHLRPTRIELVRGAPGQAIRETLDL